MEFQCCDLFSVTFNSLGRKMLADISYTKLLENPRVTKAYIITLHYYTLCKEEIPIYLHFSTCYLVLLVPYMWLNAI